MPESGDFQIILNTDSKEFGGHGRVDESLIYSSSTFEDGITPCISLYIPNRTALVLKRKE